MAVTEVMHDPHRSPIPDREEKPILLSRGAPCLVCGEWIEPGEADAYHVLVSSPPRRAEYPCHEACFERVRHANAPAPS